MSITVVIMVAQKAGGEMSRKKKIVEDVIRLIDRELQSSRNREGLEEAGRRLLARLEGGRNEVSAERLGDATETSSPRRSAIRARLSSRIGAAVTLAVGGSGLFALVLLALFAFTVALRFGSDYSEWLLAAIAPVSVMAALPALWLSVKGLSRLFGGGSRSSRAEGLSEESKEKELLEAIERCGEITPTRAAMETSLTVSEADRMLGDFTQKGYLVARVIEGGLYYALWDQNRQTPPERQPEHGESEYHMKE